MTALNKHAELRKELLNPAIGSNHHLRKLALSLLDELETAQTERDEFRSRLKLERAILADADKRITEQREYYEGVIADGSRRIAELESRDINIKRQAQALFEAIANPNDCYIPAYVRCLREALNGNSTGIGVKGE